MPIIKYSRRDFLKTSGAALASLPFVTLDSKTNQFVLVADTHIPADPTEERRGFSPVKHLKMLVDEIKDQAFDAYFVNGDLAKTKGKKQAYRNFSELIDQLDQPGIFTLGNHDHRGRFWRNQGLKASSIKKHTTTLRTDHANFMFVDTLDKVNTRMGAIDWKQLEWIDRWLTDNPEKPVLLFMHHPPYDKDIGISDADDFMQVVKKHRQVKAITYGHLHRYTHENMDGLHLINQPAISYNFRDEDPIGYMNLSLAKGKASFKLRALAGNIDSDGDHFEIDL